MNHASKDLTVHPYGIFFLNATSLSYRRGRFMPSDCRLDDLVRMKTAGQGSNPYRNNFFGFETEGSIIPVWQNNINRLAYCMNTFSLEGFGMGNTIQIMVPPTDTGLKTPHSNEQPYGWNGKINENTATMAIWWAFDILTDGESDEFCATHHPRVIFRFPDEGRPMTLVVQNIDGRWMVDSFE